MPDPTLVPQPLADRHGEASQVVDPVRVPLGFSPAHGRFLLSRVASERARQLRRGARPRVDVRTTPRPTAERVALEEVREGLVAFRFESPGLAFRGEASGDWEAFEPHRDV